MTNKQIIGTDKQGKQHTFEARVLNQEDLNLVLALQDKIIAGFHDENEKKFILDRSVADYQAVFDKDDANILGAFHQGELVGQVVYMTPQQGKVRDLAEFKPQVKNENMVVYEAILVNPHFRGCALMKNMLDYIEQNLIDGNRTTSIMQIAVGNPSSWINALKHGMRITKADVDSFDGMEVIYLEKDIPSPAPAKYKTNSPTYSMRLGKNPQDRIPQLLYKMQFLIENGYHGIAFDRNTQSLLWTQPATTRLNLKDKVISKFSLPEESTLGIVNCCSQNRVKLQNKNLGKSF